MKSDKSFVSALKTLQQFNQVIITMEMYLEDDKLVLVTKPKTIHFN